jgi:hypothetical protein
MYVVKEYTPPTAHEIVKKKKEEKWKETKGQVNKDKT